MGMGRVGKGSEALAPRATQRAGLGVGSPPHPELPLRVHPKGAGPQPSGGPRRGEEEPGPRPDGVKGPAGTPDPSSLTRMEASCLELALEGERLCKAGDFKAGVAFFEAAVQVGTEDLKTLSAIYSQLGNAYFYLKEYARALEYHKHDLLLAR